MKKLVFILIALIHSGILISQAQESIGLVAYYPFNGNANDESSYGNHGTVYGASLTTDRFGQPNSAYNFNGISDWIQIMNSNSLNIYGDVSLTICAWVCTNSPTNQGIVCKWGPGYHEDDQYILEISYPSKCLFGLSDEIAYNYSVNYMTLNEWVFVTGVYDHVYGLSNIYINGRLETTLEISFSIWNTDRYVEIGTEADGRHFNGMIDDVRIYNRAINETEVDSLYHLGGWENQASVISILDDQTLCENDSTAFEIQADGIPPIQYQWQKDGIDITGAIDSVLILKYIQTKDDGKYRCIVSNSYGSDTCNTAQLEVEFSEPTTMLGFLSVVKQQVATYSVSGKDGHTFDFIVDGGNGIDTTETSITILWGEAGLGKVNLMETSELGCVADTVTINIIIGTTGINESSGDIRCLVRPNPVKGTATFSYVLLKPNKVVLQVFNSYGLLVDEVVYNNRQKGEQKTEWNATDLGTGVYYYRIQAGDQIGSGKLVKL